jgi:Na+/melibiose symporter-like transporter
MARIGYQQGRAIGTQDERTKFWLFVMSTGLPVITGALGVLPKFLYPLTGKKRDKMYEDLFERRNSIATKATHATNQEMEELAQQQISGHFEDN